MQKNKVAAFLKAYAVVNAVCGVLLVLFVMIALSPFLSVLVFFSTALASGLIYAVGEIVDLLEEIRWNTRPKEPPAPVPEPQPEPEQLPAAPAQAGPEPEPEPEPELPPTDALSSEDKQALLALCGLPTARGMLDQARALCAGKQKLVGQEEFFRRLEQLAALEEDHGNMSVGACKELEAWLSGLRETC